MKPMDERRQLPEINQLSILTATILLAYALTPFVRIPETNLVIRLPFTVFSFGLNFATLVSLLTALLAAVGSHWLLYSHPHRPATQSWLHMVLPALMAWVLGVPLSTRGIGLEWWAIFTMGGVLLAFVFIAEYIVVDFEDARHGLATIGLTALSFALYLILTIAARSASLRLYQLLPLLGIPLALVCWRTFFLRAGNPWNLPWILGIVLVTGQVIIGLQYLALSPLAYGLVLTGLAYGLTSTAGAFQEGRPWPNLLAEPALVSGVLWLLALVIHA